MQIGEFLYDLQVHDGDVWNLCFPDLRQRVQLSEVHAGLVREGYKQILDGRVDDAVILDCCGSLWLYFNVRIELRTAVDHFLADLQVDLHWFQVDEVAVHPAVHCWLHASN